MLLCLKTIESNLKTISFYGMSPSAVDYELMRQALGLEMINTREVYVTLDILFLIVAFSSFLKQLAGLSNPSITFDPSGEEFN